MVNFSYSYNAANQRIRDALADGSYWRYDYDALGQVTSGHKYWSDQSPVAGQNFDYSFDSIGNRTQTKAGGDQHGWNQRNANYYANNLNQYTSRDVPGALDIIGVAFATNSVSVNSATPYRKGEYFWDQLTVGNSSSSVWQGVTVTSPNQPSVTGNAFVPKTPESFGYDADGNTTSDGRWNYTWDAENRLIQMTSLNGGPAGSLLQLTFTYDSQGRRIQKIVATNGPSGYVGEYTNNFIYDGWNLVAEVGPNGSVIRSYVWGSDLSGSIQGAGGVGGLLEMSYYGSPTTNCFAAYDGNGNVVALVNAANGQIIALYEYGPFGEVIRASGPLAKLSALRFSTKYEDDESDFVRYEPGRYYRPSCGGWLNRDPFEEDGGLNLYAFGGEDGINTVDPFGLWVIERWGLPRALASAQCGDTIRGLATLIKLNPDEYKKWLDPVVLTARPFALDTPLSEGDIFTIPNTAYIDYDVGPYGPGYGMQIFKHKLKRLWASRGYRVEVSRWSMSKALVLAHLNDPDIYHYAYLGHGVGGHIQPGGEDLESGKYTPFGIASMALIACDTDKEWFFWRPNVSQAGHLVTCVGPVTLFNMDWRVH